MKPYTVLLLRPDYFAEPFGQDVYLAHVYARTPREAKRVAQDEVRLVDGDAVDGEDYHPLFITEGHHQDMS